MNIGEELQLHLIPKALYYYMDIVENKEDNIPEDGMESDEEPKPKNNKESKSETKKECKQQ